MFAATLRPVDDALNSRGSNMFSDIRSPFKPVAALVAGLTLASPAVAVEPSTFRVSIESVTMVDTLVLPDGTKATAPISPGLYLVSSESFVLFKPGQRAGTPLQSLAEDGAPTLLVDALSKTSGAGTASEFLHDQDFTIIAQPGDRLHLAVMFVQSNDLFYAPREGGIVLFDSNNRAISGDRTAELVLWDAGTEINETPGLGPNQAPRQPKPNTGVDETGTVRLVDDGFQYPNVSEVIRVTITPMGNDAGLPVSGLR